MGKELATTRILGIDPGLNTTGYGVIELASRGVKLIEAGVIRGKTRGSLEARLKEIHEGVVEVIGLCGYYTMVLMTLNTFEFGLPDGQVSELA